jgi:hypothetical protein
METDLGLGGWVEAKGLHVAGVRMAGWDYGGRSFLSFFFLTLKCKEIYENTKETVKL